MATCGVCGGTGLRKTVIVKVLKYDGSLESKRVGSCCGKGIVCLLAERPKKEKNKITKADAHEIDVLRPYLQTLETRLRVKKAQLARTSWDHTDGELVFLQGEVKSLEDSIYILKERCPSADKP